MDTVVLCRAGGRERVVSKSLVVCRFFGFTGYGFILENISRVSRHEHVLYHLVFNKPPFPSVSF